jgi:hypothetical protein
VANPCRKKSEPRHIRLYHNITGTDAWKSLSGNAIKVLIALVRLDDGSKNGRIYFSNRRASIETNLVRNTCIKALDELVEKGFLRVVEKGHFDRKVRHATVWRYTWQAVTGSCGPTRDFEKWEPTKNKTRNQKLTHSGANNEPWDDFDAATGANIEPDIPPNPQKCVQAIVANIEPQIVYQEEVALGVGF